MDLGLSGKVVLVTGASSGIGAACVAAFVAEGANVVGVARRAIEEGPQVLSAPADVRVPEELARAFDAALARFGRVDVTVANAGIWPSDDVPLVRMDPARVREVVDVNLHGVLWTAQAFARVLERTGPRADGDGASLVLIGSTAGVFGERGHVEYAATKAALSGVMKTLKNELVLLDPAARVNLVEPGWTVTPAIADALQASGDIARVTCTMALRRLATPEDIAAAVLFFASPRAARHVSGEALTVAGGMEGRVLW